MIWPFPKIIDSSRCYCRICHRHDQDGNPITGGVLRTDQLHALSACRSCSHLHTIAFRLVVKPPKPKNPDPFESGEEGG